MMIPTFGAAPPARLTFAPPRRTMFCARGFTMNRQGRCVPVRRSFGQVDLSPLIRELPPHEVGMPTQAQLLEAATMWASLPPWRRHALVSYITRSFPQLFAQMSEGLSTAGSRVSSGLVPNPM